MMDRAKLVAAIEIALSKVLERDFRSVGTPADHLDAQQTDSALAAEPSRA